MRQAGEGKFPTYRLTNNNANIKRLKARIATLQAEADQPDVADREATINGTPVTVVENREEDRLQLMFGGKPPASTRKILKQNAFHWSPSQEAWQRLLNDNARQATINITD